MPSTYLDRLLRPVATIQFVCEMGVLIPIQDTIECAEIIERVG